MVTIGHTLQIASAPQPVAPLVLLCGVAAALLTLWIASRYT